MRSFYFKLWLVFSFCDKVFSIHDEYYRSVLYSLSKCEYYIDLESIFLSFLVVKYISYHFKNNFLFFFDTQSDSNIFSCTNSYFFISFTRHFSVLDISLFQSIRISILPMCANHSVSSRISLLHFDKKKIRKAALDISQVAIRVTLSAFLFIVSIIWCAYFVFQPWEFK